MPNPTPPESPGLTPPDAAPVVADGDTRRALDAALADALAAPDHAAASDKAALVRDAAARLYPAAARPDEAPAARGLDLDAIAAGGPLPDHPDALADALAADLAARWPLADAATAGLSATRPPAVAWLIRDWLPDAALTLLAGAGEVGKSTLAVQLTTALAAGRRDWITGPPAAARLALDIAAHAGAPAMLATYEDAAARVHYLAYRLADADAAPDEPRDAAADRWRANLADRWHVADLSARGPLYSVPLRAPESAGPTAAYDALRAYAQAHGVRLLVIDSAASAYDGNENDRQAVRGFLGALAALARELPAAVVLIQHPPKPARPGYRAHAYSGSTDWRNMPRAVLALEPAALNESERAAYGASPPTVRLRRDKGNYSAPPPDAWLRFDPWPRFVACDAPDAASDRSDRTGNGAAFTPADYQ